jgi:NADPH:quinone reductase-like Zn-dependent oxidoreductase
MKAAVYRSYGSPEVLKIEDIDPPSIEDYADRVLIKVHSSSVNVFDVRHRKGYFPIRLTNGFSAPRDHRLGIDVAGTIEAVGKSVSRFKLGDRVFGNSLGSHAEYTRARETIICRMPENLTFNEAAAIPTVALTALQALRDMAQIKKGQKVLIYGASGGIGHMAVQLARYYETEVTAVCSTSNLAWVKNLGADFMVDYTKEDFTGSGKKYDIILDAVGKQTFFKCRRSLTDTGIYITEHILYPQYHPIQFLLGALTGDRRAKTHLSEPGTEDLDFLRNLIETGKLRPVIEKIHPLNEIVEAHRHLETGHTKGKIVVEVRKD